MARVRVNNQFGFLGADPGISGTTLTFGAAPVPPLPTLTGEDYIPFTLDALSDRFEIVHLVAPYTSGDLTGPMVREAEDAVNFPAVAHNLPATWKACPTALDYSATIFNVLYYGADPTGVNDSTAAFQAAINDATANAGSDALGPVYVPAGKYKISGTLTVENVIGFRIYGDGKWLTFIQPTTALAGLAVFRLQDCDSPAFEEMNVAGNSSGAPLYLLQFNVGNPILLVNTRAFVKSVFFGSSSAGSATNGIAWTTSGPDDNNDQSVVLDCDFYNMTNAYYIGHSNSEQHTFIGGTTNVTGATVLCAGGGYKMISTVIINTSGTMFEFGAGTYRRGTEIIGVSSEQSGAWVNAVTGAIGLNLRMVGCVCDGAPASSTPINFEADITSHFRATNCDFVSGQTGTILNFPTAALSSFTDCTLDCYSITFDSALNLIGNLFLAGNVTMTNGGSGVYLGFANTGGNVPDSDLSADDLIAPFLNQNYF